MATERRPTLSAVVPTYGRHEVLVETLARILALEDPPDELIVVDQTVEHPEEVCARLADWEAVGLIRRLRQPEPSIPEAMNAGIRAAHCELLLFLDDDLIPGEGLVAAHRQAHLAFDGGLVAGQVLQPGEEPEPLAGDRFAFRSSLPQQVGEFMGGNFSVRRATAIAIGGLDENFVGAAYRFERDFSLRALREGARILFEPGASIRHLRAPSGGTRVHGSHLTTARPGHSVGEYYYLLVNRPAGCLRAATKRLERALFNRHHLQRPWWIPVTAIGEALGLAWALLLLLRGRRLLSPPGAPGGIS